MFHLFGGDEIYYACGGANDFIKSFETQEEAEKFANSLYESEILEKIAIMWWQITDKNLKIIAKSINTPHRGESGYAKWALKDNEFIEFEKNAKG